MIINDLGMLYRISKRGWRTFCKAQAAGEMAGLSQFGARSIGYIEHNITDWCQKDYAEEIGIEVDDKE